MIKNNKALTNKKMELVLRAFIFWSGSAANRKKAVSNPKVKTMFTNEIKAYKLVKAAYSIVSSSLM